MRHVTNSELDQKVDPACEKIVHDIFFFENRFQTWIRKVDETIVEPDDAEVEWDEQNDELEDYFTEEQTPKVLLMTRNAPRGPMTQMCRELLKSIPNSTYLMRHGFALKKLIPVVSFEPKTSEKDELVSKNNV